MKRETCAAFTAGILMLSAAAWSQTFSGALESTGGVAMVASPTNAPTQPGRNLRVSPRRLRDYNVPGLTNRVNLTSINDWKVVELLEFLAYRGGLNNLVISKGVSGLTTKLKFEAVSVGDALEVVLSVNRLAYEVRGDILSIMTDEEYKAINGSSFLDQKQVRTVELKYADANRVATMVGSVKSDIGTVVADQVTGTLILIDTPGKIDEMMGVVESADIPTVSRMVPTVTRAFVLQHADVEAIQQKVTGMLTPDLGKIISDERTKAIVITDLPHNVQRIAEVIGLFDRRPKQVFIEAKVVRVGLSGEYALGINWEHVFQGIDPRFALNSMVRRPILGPDNPGIAALDYKAIVGDATLNMVLEALESVGKTTLLSNPHVAVIDGEEAMIGVVEDTPYAETAVEVTGGDTNFVGETIKFIQVGVSLKVKPKISDNGMISMSLRPEISSASYDYQAFRKIPTVQKTFTDTTIMIQDGETVIIAGMIQNNKANQEWRVPYLGRIPLLGLLFKSREEKNQSAETVVFLTPRIITGETPTVRGKDAKKQPKPLRASKPGD